MRVRSKVLLAVALAVLAAVSVTGTALYGVRRARTATVAQRDAQSLADAVLQQNVLTNDYLSHGTDRADAGLGGFAHDVWV